LKAQPFFRRGRITKEYSDCDYPERKYYLCADRLA
jgi:hypothetical protein